MLLSEPVASLITFFRTSLIEFYLNSQQISDSFYHITKSSKLNLTIRVQNVPNLPCRLGTFCCFCVRWHHDVNIGKVRFMMSWNLISHMYKIRKFVMAILHWKQGLLCDKKRFKILHTSIRGCYIPWFVYMIYFSNESISNLPKITSICKWQNECD